jgi:hypothetical protein
VSNPEVIICRCGQWNRFAANADKTARLVCCSCTKTLYAETPDSTGPTIKGDAIRSASKLPAARIRWIRRSAVSIVGLTIIAALFPLIYLIPNSATVNPPRASSSVASPGTPQPARRSNTQSNFGVLVPPIPAPLPCAITTKAECSGRPACYWDEICVAVQGGWPKCELGVCRERTQTYRPTDAQPTATPAVSISLPPDAAKAQVSNPGLPSPPTGILHAGRHKRVIAPLTIETESGTNYLLRLVNVSDPSDEILIYLRGGETYSTKAPLGTYRLRGASGQTWYGRNDLFGPYTQFFQLRPRDGKAENDASLIRFTSNGRQIMGAKLSLKRVLDGNIEQQGITRQEFLN